MFSQLWKSLTLKYRLFVFLAVAYFLKRKLSRKQKKTNLTNKVVLITGGGNGIGRCQAIEFAKKKCTLILWDINEKNLKETAEYIKLQYQIPVYTFVVDVTNREKVYQMAQKVKEECGAVFCLVNNAGIVSGNLLMDTPDARILKTFEVNTISHFWTVKSFLPDMMKTGGHIVTIASIASMVGAPKLVDYCSSKFGARGFHEGLTQELHYLGYENKIHTTCVCPGPIDTSLFAGFANNPLCPTLKQEEVGAKIIQAVEERTRLLVLPKTVYPFVAIIPMVFPYCVQEFLAKNSGARKAMETHDPSHANKVFHLMSDAASD